MKKILYFILSIAFVLSLSSFLFSCGGEEPEEPEVPGPCTEHKDEDENGICDVCKQVTVEIPETPSEVTVSFTVKDQDGLTVPAITVTFTEKGKTDATPISATSGANGQFTADLLPATYKVECDYDFDVVGGYYYSDTSEVKVEKNTTSLDILLVNNTPNGSVDRPFSLSVGDNEIKIPAKTTHNFIVYRAVNLIASIEGEGIKLCYNGTEYTPNAENKIEFSFLGTDFNSAEVFSIENLLDAEATCEMKINSKPGTYGNPYVIETLGAEISKSGLTSEDTVYYSYRATDTVRLVLTVTSENTHVAMQFGSHQVTTDSEGGNVISIEVNADDLLMINVSTTVKENATVSFVLEIEISEY